MCADHMVKREYDAGTRFVECAVGMWDTESKLEQGRGQSSRVQSDLWNRTRMANERNDGVLATRDSDER